MREYSQLELMEEGFLDSVRRAGGIAKAAVKGAAKGVYNMDPTGFNTIAAPFKTIAAPVAAVYNQFKKDDPKMFVMTQLKAKYFQQFDINTVKILSVEGDKNEAVAATAALSGTPGTAGTAAISATPGTIGTLGTLGVAPTYTNRDPNSQYPQRFAPTRMVTPGTPGTVGTLGTLGTPGVAATAGTQGTPGIAATPGSEASNVKGRIIVTFSAKKYMSTGTEPAAIYKAVLTKNFRKGPLTERDAKWSMDVLDSNNQHIEPTQTRLASFMQIFKTFATTNKINPTADVITPDEAKLLLADIYKANKQKFDPAAPIFVKLLSTPQVKVEDIHAVTRSEKLTEKVQTSQRDLIEQLISLL